MPRDRCVVRQNAWRSMCCTRQHALKELFSLRMQRLKSHRFSAGTAWDSRRSATAAHGLSSSMSSTIERHSKPCSQAGAGEGGTPDVTSRLLKIIAYLSSYSGRAYSVAMYRLWIYLYKRILDGVGFWAMYIGFCPT